MLDKLSFCKGLMKLKFTVKFEGFPKLITRICIESI